MTTLSFHLSHSLASSPDLITPSSNVVLSRLCHDGNVSPWTRMAETKGAKVRWTPIVSGDDDIRLDVAAFESNLDADTAFVAIGMASNATGTVNPVKDMIK